MRDLPINRLAAAFVLLPLVACDGPDRPDDTSIRRDSAGVTIVENLAPKWQPGAEWQVDSVPLLAIDPDAGSGAEFQTVTSVVRLDDGTTVALDWRDPFVRAFDASGELVWTAVRQGSGPGELRNASLLARIRGDSLIVEEGRFPRSVLLAPDGAIVGDVPAFAPPATGGGGDRLVIPTPVLRLHNGDGIAYVGTMLLSDLTGSGTYTSIGDFYLTSRDDGSRALGAWPVLTMGRGEYGPIALFGSRMSIAALPDGFVYAWPTRDELRVYGSDGSLRMLVRGPGESRAPTSDEISAAREARIARAGDTPDVVRAEEGRPVADTMPHFRRLVASSSGEIWRARLDPVLHACCGQVPEFASQPTLWDVLAADGTLLGSVALPPRFDLMSAGDDWIAGVHADEMDVQTPRVYRLLKP